MSLIVPNTGKQKMLEYMLGVDTSVENVVLRLYTNDATPTVNSIHTDFTALAAGTGYSEITLTPSSWTITSGSATYPQQTWTFTGSVGNIYGYYASTATSNELLMAERFNGAPFNIASNGDAINVTLGITVS